MDYSPEIIESVSFEDISDAIGDSNICVSNGSFSKPAAVIVPQMQAGFQFVCDYVASSDDALVVFTNSDKSFGALYTDGAHCEPQEERLRKVLEPLAASFNRRVIGGFYDQQTPRELFSHLASRHSVLSHFKWGGYGSDKNTPVIEGAENIHAKGGRVFAFPTMPEDVPSAYDLTRVADQTSIVEVVDLYRVEGLRPNYLYDDNSLVFDID